MYPDTHTLLPSRSMPAWTKLAITAQRWANWLKTQQLPCRWAEGNATAIEQTSVAARTFSCGWWLGQSWQKPSGGSQTCGKPSECCSVTVSSLSTLEQDKQTEGWWVRRTPRHLPMLPQTFWKSRQQSLFTHSSCPLTRLLAIATSMLSCNDIHNVCGQCMQANLLSPSCLPNYPA